MREKPRVGLTGEHRFVVGQEHVIDFADGGMPAVLSTPTLVRLLERTSREALAPLLEPHERTVGVSMEIRHLSPTPLGANVTCGVRVIQVDRTLVTFVLEVRDDQEVVARGLHKRRVINVEKFAQRVARKKR
jgi:fluoroacetyl-CoA thioesterase